MKVTLTRMAVLACMLVCCTGVRAQTPNPFMLPVPTNSSGGAFSADLNGDGRADIVTLLGAVYFGNADGTFTLASGGVSIGNTSSNCGTSACPISFTVLALADFTGDGKPDLLLLAQTTFLYVAPGNGDGTFGKPVATNAGTGLWQVQAIDVNGDGKLDIVALAVGVSNGQVLVYLGNGDGTFQSGVTYTVFANNSISQLIVGDFNGDGKVDIAAAGYTANANGPVGVMLGHGDGTFGAAVTSAGVNSPTGIVTADFNGDGKLDLVVGGVDVTSSAEQTYILFGKGDGTFQAPTVVAPGYGSLSERDFNGDGKADLIIWASPFNEVYVGNGDGTFTLKATYPNSNLNGGSIAAVGDFNGDGHLDISDGLTVIFGNGDGTFQDVPATIVSVQQRFQPELNTVAAGDFNGDGKPDLAVGLNGPNPSIYILLGDVTGKYSVGQVYSIPAATLTLQTADLNHDGKLDLIFNTGDGSTIGNLETMLGNGDGTFGAPMGSSLIAPKFQLADFNGDGFLDVAALANGELAVLIGAGDGTFASAVSNFGGANANTFAVGDFNGDGKPDAVVCGSAGIGVLLNKGDGTFEPSIFPDPPPPPTPPVHGQPTITTNCEILASGDFNNDGATDVVVGQFEAISTLLSNGDGTFTTVSAGSETTPAAAIADVNGDGNLDLISSDGLSVTLGNGDGSFSGTATYAVPWINPKIWQSVESQNEDTSGPAVFAVDAFSGSGLPGIAMIVQSIPGGEISLPNPFTPPAPDFQIVTTIPGLLQPGGQIAVTVSAKAIGAFTGDVELSCGNLPAGVTCGFASGTITGGSGQTTLTVSAASSATLGRYPFTVSGTSGADSHTRQSAVTIATTPGATNANLLPTSLSYSTALGNSIMATQTTTLTNAGSVPLQVSGVTVTGTNAKDFSVPSNTCAQPIPAYATCVISVTFAPTASGARSATLVVNDNATGGVQVASLSGTAQDFTIAAGTGGASATIAAGKTATYSISVGGAGFAGSVALSCSGAPTAATCAVSPASVTLNGSAAATATVTVTTTARSLVVPTVANRDDQWMPGMYGAPRVVFALAGFAFCFGVVVIYGLRTRRKMSYFPIAAACLLVLAGIAIGGCGGGGTASNPSGGSATGTPAGNYTITVTATAGSGANAVRHTTTLTLVVQ
jgi:FG-GAP-like repeat